MRIKKTLADNKTAIFVSILILFSAGHLLFALLTNSFFSVDDFAVLAYLKDNSLITMVGEFLTKGDVFGFRKVGGFLVFGSLFSLFGANAEVFTYANFVLHTVNLLLLFFVVRRLTKKDYIAFFVSILFNKYYLFYFSNFHEYVATLFVLLSVFLFLRFPKKTYLSLIFFILALLTKELAFGLPLFIFAISYVFKKDIRKTIPFFAVLLFYGAYQGLFFLNDSLIPKNTSYQLSFDLRKVIDGLFYYLNPKVLAFALALPLLTKRYKALAIFAAGILTLLPAIFFVNRREMYYLYLPVGFILIYLGYVFPKSPRKAVLTFLIAIYVFGGRAVFPKVARQEFPNWQKVSLVNVVDRVEENVQKGEVDLEGINLERDAKLMLESGVLELFVKDDTSKMYDFSYNKGSNTVTVEEER